MNKTIISIAIASALLATGCSEDTTSQQTNAASEQAAKAEVKQENPLLKASPLQYEAPVFDQIKDEHFLPAFEQGIKEQMAEVEEIANNPEPATFENTMVALEKSGELLTRVSRIFFNLAGSNSNPERREIQTTMAPKLAAHSDNINLNSKLFARVETLYNQRNDLELDAESQRLIEEYYTDFIRAGAKLNDKQKDEIRKLNEEHSRLTTQFSQNLLTESKNIAVVVDTAEELKGLSEAEIKGAAEAAKEADQEGKYLLNLTNTTRQPVLASLENRELRQRIWEASANRAQSGEFDNSDIVARLAKLRAEKAALLGYDNWASYGLDAQMAQTPQAVFEMLGSMVPAVVANVKEEAADIQAMIDAEGEDFELKPWDWAYYAEKVREARYDLDEDKVKQYFEFNRVLNDGVFYTFNRLYGVRFEPRPDLPVYHPDVKAYELFDVDGKSLAIFYADYYAREGKRGGAWMSSFVGQSKLLNNKPVVVNVMNIEKAPEGEPTLISYDNVTTMFHELGHGLHGMLSDVKYPSLAGTSVSRDFVEFPSTFEEDWAAYPEVIANYAKHYETGEPIPKELLDKVIKSRSFNMGFDTLEYMSAALLDMEWHSLPADAPLQDINEFEAKALAKHGVDLAYVPPRYKSAYFSHSMGGGYSAGYYAYMWSEILAADAFAYVQEMGGLKLENGMKYRNQILSKGNSRPPMESYKAFRGQEPTTDALLIRRGLKTKVD
ncbi:M3 family metallopeptidase [Alteromonas pelagimontana]|uniref:M3 family metallopeptidase n=1 Tax=Alteromonas pelagimontana TaxID=1858656 RepID=A0A6M4MDC8_9ALTE|nr:M3 family metallopeptidase [Alteromonas pelagimontana]QJR81089.1 M3 family metallopeptidase [Alteromonas pelagimontana]